ncbi:MAG: T9SS type A sorting domain-containing protein [Draconibacterium sp.]
MKKIYLLLLFLVPVLAIRGQELKESSLPGTCGIINNQQFLKSANISLKSASSTTTLHSGTSKVEVIAQSPTSTENCIPFGQNTEYGFQGFVYRDIPAFTMNVGDSICFDLGNTNDVPINRNIYFSAANINPAPYNGTSQGVAAVNWVLVVPESQTPINPYGNTIVGDFELVYVCTSSFSFPGGGFIIGFGATPPGTYVDNGCEQVLNVTNSGDASGLFYCRFYYRTETTTEILDQGNFDNFELASFIIKSGLGLPNVTLSTNSTSCSAVYNYSFPVPEKGSVVQTAGLPTGSEFPAGTTTNCFLVTDSLGVESTSCFTVTVVDSVAPVAECKEAGGTGKAAYIISTAGQPWGQSTNEQAMDMVFGAGNWDQLYYETLDANALLSENYDFIFMEGGAHIADEMETFVDANISKMETWVANGGTLFLNAAPNEGDGMNWGFWGITLQYNSGPYSGNVKAVDINHPIFTGPFAPVTNEYTGTYFAHAIIPEELNVKFLINEYNNPDYHVLSEFDWEKGKVFVGGMTTTNFHSPQPDAFNLRANILNYLGTKSSLEFELDEDGQVTITPEDIDGGSTDNCGIASIELDRTQFTTADLGEQIVTLTVTDNAGNSSTCQSTIKILEGATDQKAVCNPININLDADGTYKLDSLDMVEITGLSPDSLMSFDDMKIFAYPDKFTCANIEWPVFIRITEYDKNYIQTRCWAMVTVHDATPPAFVGNDMELALDETGLAMITTEQLMDSATFDGCGIDTAYIDKNTFTCADIGENWVILSVTDIHGNVGTDSVLVTVKVDMPAIDSIQDVNVTTAIGVCETTIEYPFTAINEVCGISATQTAGLGHDGLFPVGTTTETWMVIDYKGDTTEVSFNVNVTSPNAFPALDEIADVTVDEDAPEISVPVSGITYGNDCQAQTVTVVAESDNTELVDSVAVVYTDGDTTGLVNLTLVPDMSGTAKITVTVTDSEGASMFRHFNLVVNEVADTIANKDGNLATAVWTKEIETGINMYPNPTQDMVTIDIRNYSASQTEVAVFSITGSEVLRKKYPAGETIRFSMNEQVSGVYLVKMNIDGNHIIKKLVVDKK